MELANHSNQVERLAALKWRHGAVLDDWPRHSSFSPEWNVPTERITRIAFARSGEFCKARRPSNEWAELKP